jgi:hypothetical protein
VLHIPRFGTAARRIRSDNGIGEIRSFGGMRLSIEIVGLGGGPESIEPD